VTCGCTQPLRRLGRLPFVRNGSTFQLLVFEWVESSRPVSLASWQFTRSHFYQVSSTAVPISGKVTDEGFWGQCHLLIALTPRGNWSCQLSTTAALSVVKVRSVHLESDRSGSRNDPPLSPRKERGEPRQSTRLLVPMFRRTRFRADYRKLSAGNIL